MNCFPSRPFFCAASTAALLIFLVAGCTSRTRSTVDSGEKPDVERQETGEHRTPQLTRSGNPPAEDDTLLMYYGDDPDTLNLVTSNDSVSTAFQQQVYEPLAGQMFADPDKFEPALAESWEFDPDTLTYTIHLRKGVFWHPMALPDGKSLPRTEFTAADVKFTFDCILNENVEAAAIRSYYTNPDAKDSSQKNKIKVQVVDDYTVKIQWTEPYMLADTFTLAIQIMPRHVYGVDEHGEPITLDYRNSEEFAKAFNNHWANTKMCGTGPMIFQKWQEGEQVTLVRNPDYWGQPFYFSAVVYRYISNPNTALQMVLQNELDRGSIPQIDQFVQSQEHPNVKSGKVKLVDYFYPGYRYIGYNQKRELFKDKRVRWALSHAVPVNEIIEKIYFGLATRVTGPFLPGSPSNDPDLAAVPFDLEKAGQLLDEAGWKDTDDNGIRDKTVAGQQVEAVFDLMIFSDSPQYRQIAEIIRENCRRIGLDVKITPTKWALMLQKLRKKEFDACILGWAMDWKNDPFQLWHGSQADLPESSNSIGYQDPEVDRLIEELRVTLDESKQVELYHQIHQRIYDAQPYTFLFSEKATAGFDSRIQNVNFYKIRPGTDAREWYSSRPRILAD